MKVLYILLFTFTVFNLQAQRSAQTIEAEIDRYESRIQSRQRSIAKIKATNSTESVADLEADIKAYEQQIAVLLKELETTEQSDRTEAAFVALQEELEEVQRVLREKELLIDSLRKVVKNCSGQHTPSTPTVSPTVAKVKPTNTQGMLKVLDFEMLPVKGGRFQMGWTADQGKENLDKENGNIEHEVELSDFYMAKYEVTQKQWKAIMGRNPSKHKRCDECPVENISKDDIDDFIRKLNAKTGKSFRLPTEAEWEYAARGGQKDQAGPYPGGDNLNSVGWTRINSSQTTHPVGKKAPNELGIYDMSGNVAEYCSDYYEKYKPEYQKNPYGGRFSFDRILRGGHFDSAAIYTQVAYRRRRHHKAFKGRYYGIRLAL